MDVGSRQQGDFVRDTRLVLRYTRNWLHYGMIVFIAICSLVAALRGAVTP